MRKNKTRILAILISVVMILQMIPSIVNAEDTIYNDIVFNPDYGVVMGYTGNPTNIVIPKEIVGIQVKGIAAEAFDSCTSLVSITLPDTLEVIGTGAFYGCTNLADIIIPSSVTSIYDYAFGQCYKLQAIYVASDNPSYESYNNVLYNKGRTEIISCPAGISGDFIIPNTVTSIKNDAFQYCYQLTTIQIPNTISKIVNNTFYACYSLTTINLPSSVEQVGKSAFSYCTKLSNINVDNNNLYYSSINGILYNKQKTELITCPEGISGDIILPNTLEVIKANSFRNCDKISDITLPNSLTTIEQIAFENCTGLTSISIPKSVNSIEYTPFYGCTNLNNITVDPLNIYFITDDDILYNIDKTELIVCAPAKTGEVIIPDTVSNIKIWSFYMCKISNVTIPERITKIGDQAFAKCSNLTDVMFLGNAPGACLGRMSLLFAEGSPNLTLWYLPIKTGFTTPKWEGYACYPVESKPVTEKNGTFQYRDYKNGTSTTDYYYMDRYFSQSAYEYRLDLATMSMCLALSTFRKEGSEKDYTKSSDNVKQLLNDIGFKNIEVNDGFENKPTANSIGVAVAHKPIDPNEDGEESTLIAVAICGGGYESEWSGNFNVGTGDIHSGFLEARNEAIFSLKNYINEYSIKGNIKLWITGYSRAAATANLVAGRLNDIGTDFLKVYDNDIVEVTLSSEDIYAYCFEPPAGIKGKETTDYNISTNKYEKNNQYRNIFNIVNPNDFVTKVAPDVWGYGRYGITKPLPSAETEKDYSIYKKNMLEQYAKLSGLNISDYKVDNFEIRKFPLGLINSSKPISEWWNLATRDEFDKRSQRAFLDDFFKVVALDILKSPENFEKNYEYRIRTFLDENTNWDFTYALPKIVELLAGLGLNPNLTATFVANLENIVEAHQPELCLAWMRSLDSSYKNSGKYREIKINCPVDIEVYDSTNTVVARIINDIPQNIEGSSIISALDSDGQKVIYLPDNEAYDLKIKAIDDGTMTYSVNEVNQNTGNTERIINYYEIPIIANDELTGTVENLESVEIAEYTLTDSNGELVAPSETLNSNDIKDYSVNVIIEGTGIAIGGGIRTKGEYVKVTAITQEGSEFLGWYIGNEKITNDEEYRFCVTSNKNLIAKFTTINTSNPSPTPNHVSGNGGRVRTYSIIFNTDGGNKVVTQRIVQNGKVTKPVNPTKEGFTFNGWFTDEDFINEYDFNTAVTSNITIYAKWIENIIEKPIHSEEWRNPFTDVNSDDWFYNAVQYVAEKGITQGISTSLYDPQGKVTRAQFIAMLCRAYNIEEKEGDNFSDSGNTWYTGYLAAAKQLGISNGVGDNNFAPDIEITREQMVTLIYNFVNSVGEDPVETGVTNLTYIDKDKISEWAIKGVKFATVKKWVKGKDESTFDPQGTATRAELAQILYNMFNNQ